jgi:hypothetical protein
LATTQQFLDDLGLRSLSDLPALTSEGMPVDPLGQQAIDFEAALHAQAALPLEALPAPDSDSAPDLPTDTP